MAGTGPSTPRTGSGLALMTLGGLLKGIWRGVVPAWLRGRLANSRWIDGVKSGVRAVAFRHEDIYDELFFAGVERTAAASAPTMAETIMRDLQPLTVLDIGCGTGALLAELVKRGADAKGLEYSEAGLAKCRARGLQVLPFDLERAVPLSNERVDVVVSVEVAEHLPERFADSYAELVARSVRPGGVVVFTAATPGQGGVDHVNEQPHSYWIKKLQSHGLTYDAVRSKCWREAWENRTAPWYSTNVMLFRSTAP